MWVLPASLLASVVILFLGERRFERRRQLFLGHQSRKTRSRVLVIGLLSAAFFAITYAALRPRLGYETLPIKKSAGDIMIAVDVSQSMFAKDVAPSRIERARREILDLLELLKGDRVGLLLFAGVGFVQAPLTEDYSAVELFLDHLRDSYIPVQGTAIGDAIRLAQKSLIRENTESDGKKTIIVISDGEDHESAAQAAANKAKQAGITIHSIGIGTEEGAPVPSPEGGFVKDRSGATVLSRFTGETLKDVADITGGEFVKSVAGDYDLRQLYQTRLDPQLNSADDVTREDRVWNEIFYYFSLLAAGLLFLELWLSRLSPANELNNS